MLIEVGSIRGVLTAGHVVHALKERGEGTRAALLTIVNRKQKSRPLEFFIGDCHCVTIGGRNHDPAGPDLGFVRLPHETEERLLAENVFHNFDVRLKAAIAEKQDESLLNNHVIVGVIGEQSVLKEFTSTTRTDTHTMTHAYGEIRNLREGNCGFDIFDFGVAHNEEVARPKSYGGLSGAGVWAVGEEPGANKRSLFGVAFQETATDLNGNRSLVCHGPACIYRELVNELRKTFADFKQPVVGSVAENDEVLD